MPSNVFGNVLQLTPVAEVLREAKADSKRSNPFPPLDHFITIGKEQFCNEHFNNS